jgi:hypothetical protein
VLAARVAVDSPRQDRQLFGGHARIVALPAWFQDIGGLHVRNRIALHQIIGHAVTHDLATVLQKPPGHLQVASSLDLLRDVPEFHGGDLGRRPGADLREDVTLKPPDDVRDIAFAAASPTMGKPRTGHRREVPLGYIQQRPI